MKTKILTLISLLALVVLSTGLAFATSPDNDAKAVVVTDAVHFNKIEVRGNVELHISDGAADQVQVYNRYYSESALVQSQNGVLRIASYKNQKLVVWVTVNDLRELAAYDNVQVKSFGKLSAITLDVKLYNNASAQLDLNVFSGNITLNDRARADLKGNATECWLTCRRSATVNQTAFSAQRLVQNNVPHVSAKSEQFAGL